MSAYFSGLQETLIDIVDSCIDTVEENSRTSTARFLYASERLLGVVNRSLLRYVDSGVTDELSYDDIVIREGELQGSEKIERVIDEYLTEATRDEVKRLVQDSMVESGEEDYFEENVEPRIGRSRVNTWYGMRRKLFTENALATIYGQTEQSGISNSPPLQEARQVAYEQVNELLESYVDELVDGVRDVCSAVQWTDGGLPRYESQQLFLNRVVSELRTGKEIILSGLDDQEPIESSLGCDVGYTHGMVEVEDMTSMGAGMHHDVVELSEDCLDTNLLNAVGVQSVQKGESELREDTVFVGPLGKLDSSGVHYRPRENVTIVKCKHI